MNPGECPVCRSGALEREDNDTKYYGCGHEVHNVHVEDTVTAQDFVGVFGHDQEGASRSQALARATRWFHDTEAKYIIDQGVAP